MQLKELKNGRTKMKNGNKLLQVVFLKTIHYPYKTLIPKVVPFKDSKKVTAARKEIMARLVLRKSKYSESKFSERVALWIK